MTKNIREMTQTKSLKQKIREIQFKIGKISKEKENPFYNSKYFDINQLLEQLIPLLQEQNLTLIQPLSYSEQNDRTILETVISDDNEELKYSTPLPQNVDPQKMGSIITYYRRYTLQSLFCLQAEDDDGNRAVEKKSTKKQTVSDLDL